MIKKPIVRVSSRELAYRTEHYHDIKVIKDRQIVCASCGNLVIVEAGKIFAHPVMGTLQCEKCWDHFNNIDFSSDEDHVDKYCRLCAHEKNLYICGSVNCTIAFCKRCIKRNASLSLLDIEKKNWKCFVCEPKPLWELRAVCASVMDSLIKKSKRAHRRNAKIRDSISPSKRYQNMQMRKMQKTLKSLCDESDEECDNDSVMDKQRFYYKSSGKGENSTDHITLKKNKCQRRITSKKSIPRKFFATTSSESWSDVEVPKKKSLSKSAKVYKTKVSYEAESSSDTKFDIEPTMLTTGKKQSQKKLNLGSSKSDINDLSSDELNKTKSSKLLDTYIQKKNKYQAGTSSCLHTSNSEESEQSQRSKLCSKIKRYHTVVKHDKTNTNKFSNCDKKSIQLNSDLESEGENMEMEKKIVKTIPKRSNKKKSSIKQSANESDNKKIISQSLQKIDTDSSSGREFQKTKLVPSSYNLLFKKHDKQLHITSTKRNVIRKEQCKYFKSYITEILDELKQQCSVFELQAQHIEHKCKRRPMYLEGVEKIIYKSKSAINKIITDFKSYEKNLVNFYNSFILSIRDEKYENSEDETVLINKKQSKRKCDGEKCNDSRSEIVSDCDSEIFSENDISPERTKLENSNSKNEIPHSENDNERTSKSSKSLSPINNIVESVELRTSQNASPILGKQQVRRNLPKSTAGKCNINEETSDIQNSETQNDVSKNSMLENIIEGNDLLNDPKNKSDEDETLQSISSQLLTAMPSTINSAVMNNSLNDLFTSSFESENEINKIDTVTNDTVISSIQKEHNETSNTKYSEPKEDILSSNDKEINSSREQEHDYAHIFEQKTQEIFEPNKSSSDSEKITTKNDLKKNTTSENVISSKEDIIKNPKNKSPSQTDSDILDTSNMPSDYAKKNQLKRSKSEKHTDIESDCSTVILNDLDKSENITKDTSDNDTSDNVKQNDNAEDKLRRSSSEKRSLCDTESNQKIEELIRNALLESDSDDSTPSSTNKEIEGNKELCSTDSSKIKSAVSDNGSTKSDKSQMNDTKSFKSFAQKRNHDLESNLSVGSRVKRRRLQLQKNYYYINDKKLRMICHVEVEKLKDEILHRYKHALKKSKEYQSDKKLKSLIDLDALEKPNKKKRSSVSDSTLSNEDSKLSLKSLKSKKNVVIEEEDSLMDHLKKVQDGNAPVNMEDASDNEAQTLNAPMDRYSAILTNDNLMLEADNNAKKLLLNSSDSNLDDDKEQETMSDNKDEDTPNEKNKSTKQKKIKKEVLESDNGELLETDEEKELKNKKSKWKKNKLLTMKLSDNDSEKEKEKWEKSQQKLTIKEEDSDEDIISIKKKTSEHKRKKNNRIIDSDSDVKEINADSSDSDLSNSTSEVLILSSSDEVSDKKQKKKRKRKIVNKSSDTESSDTIKRPKLKRIKNISRDSSSDNDEVTSSPGKSSKPGRKNIRKVLKDKQVAEDTKQAAKEEEERLKRIMERQKLYNEMYETRLAGEEKVEKLVLDFNPDTKEELISVNEDLVKRLKPHQAKGIKFMWDACFESLERIKTTSGSGCIIAHCMGLGKTLQVITLSHTLLTHEATGVKCILVVCPLSTVLNWTNEFHKWLKDVENGDIEIYELTKCKKDFERKYKLQYWHKHGGVLIIGYEMFRTITGKKNMRKNMKEAILQCLVDPGPDLVICDEGHLLKNEDTALSKCMKNIKTLRRIVLTGTPLQNNLIEYHCMVQFVKPNLLGTKKEFLNRFANPITNGQFDNSTEYDVKIMKKRAHVLHKLLQGSVQRFDYSVLTPFLPPKQEYVIFVRLTDVQIKLYQYYLDNLARRSGGKGALFTDYQALQRIWTHPLVLQLNAEKIEKANEKKRYVSDSEGSLVNFVVSDDEETSSTSDSDSDVKSVHSQTSITSKRKTRSNTDEDNSEPGSVEMVTEKEEWWSQFIETEHFNDIRISAKLVLLFGILKESEKIGDKVLVFSQSLYSLTLIEQFLAQIDEAAQDNVILENLDGHTGSWTLGLDYFRLDGQTSAENRNVWCKIFNRPTNTRARLFLISTRAGGLGINLTAANRVIIFDASWNPSHDIQSIFRVYRFGQKKPCYIYRFLAAGTMEEKIYNRQVTKLSLSCRVVDEQQIERHYSHNALNELYKFEPVTNADKPTLNLPTDRMLAEIFLKYKDLVDNYHEHDSLLENKADEELNEEERKQAWLEYEEEKKGIPQINPAMATYQNNVLLQQYNMMANRSLQNIPLVNNANRMADYENLNKLIEKDYPNATPEQRKLITTRTLMDMYNYWEQQAMIQSNRNPIITQNTQQNIQQNIQQKTVPLVANNVSTATTPNWLRQQLLQNPSSTYTTSNANTNIPNPPLKDIIVNPYAYPKASTSNSQIRNEIPQVTIDTASTQEATAKATTVPTAKEQEE